MRFFISSDLKRNELLRLIVLLTLVFFILLWITNILLYLQVGFNYESIVQYYRGSEENFRPPRSYLGMLEEAHFHLFSMAIILVTLTHLVLFTSLNGVVKLILIVSSYLSALGDISGGFLVRYFSPEFAYFKLASFAVLQISLAAMIFVIIYYLFSSSKSPYSNNY